MCDIYMLHSGTLYDFFFFFKQKTAYELRISDWSADVCSSDLPVGVGEAPVLRGLGRGGRRESGGQRRKLGPEGSALFPHLRTLLGPHLRAVAAQPSGRIEERRGGLACIGLTQCKVEHHLLRASTEERRVGKECVSKCRF